MVNLSALIMNQRYHRSVGRLIIGAGVVLILIGLLVLGAERLHIRLGRLPGDIVYQGKNSSFYFPIVTCVLVSIVASLVLWLMGRFR
jgi:hypothetical protein